MKYVWMALAILLWAYGMVRAETNWRFVPLVGHVIGAVCIVEDYMVPKK